MVSDLIGPQSLDPSQRSEDVFASPDQLAGELATLTLLPRSRWQTLLKLEVIQVSNEKPHPPALHNDLDSNTFLGPPVCSNGTNQKSLRSRWRRPRSSCLHSQVLSTDSRFKRGWIRPRKRRNPPNASKIQRQRPRAPFCRSFGENPRPVPVSSLFFSLGHPTHVHHLMIFRSFPFLLDFPR